MNRSFIAVLALAISGAITPAAAWTLAPAKAVKTSEHGVSVYRGAIAEVAAGAELAGGASVEKRITVVAKAKCGFPPRRLAIHGFLGERRAYRALGRFAGGRGDRSFVH